MELTPEDKIAIAEQHLKSVLYTEYNNSLSLIEAQASTNPNQTNIDNLNNQSKDIAAQKAALKKEIDAQNAILAGSTTK